VSILSWLDLDLVDTKPIHVSSFSAMAVRTFLAMLILHFRRSCLLSKEVDSPVAACEGKDLRIHQELAGEDDEDDDVKRL